MPASTQTKRLLRAFPSDSPSGRVDSLDVRRRLQHAIAANDVAAVEELLSSKRKLRQVLNEDVPLMRVAQRGRIPMMEVLLPDGAETVPQQRPFRSAALYVDSYSGRRMRKSPLG